jgi:hypothetical protein
LAQNSVLSVGVRGGGQMMLPTAVVGATGTMSAALGGAGTLDLRYTFYGQPTDRIGIGFAVSAGVGYGSAGVQGASVDTYTNSDYTGNQLDYTCTASYTRIDRFAKADAALFFAMRFGGVTVNLGPRFMLPFAASSALTLRSASIDAYYPAYDVHVRDQLITGKLVTPYTQARTPIHPRYSLLVAAEIGYEWSLSEQSSLGLQLYADVAVWNSAGKNPAPISPLIQVSPITSQENPAPAVTVGDITPMINDLRNIDFGLRVYYAFSFKSSTGYKSRFNTRDTRLHHNRYRWW